MKMSSSFIQRTCPCCGSAEHRPEALSERQAECLSLDALKPFWSGFHTERVFFSYHRCTTCGLLFAPVFFSDAQLQELYAQLAPNMEDVPGSAIESTQLGYFEMARSQAAKLTGGYLEIGPDVGHVSRIAAREGKFEHFWLFEPNLAVHEQLAASTQGLPHSLSHHMTDLSAVPDGTIGLAVMVHVLDHLIEPLAMLEQVWRKLRPGGALLIVTHNEDSLMRKVLKGRWPPFCLQHPEVYSPHSMREILGRAGYEQVIVQRSKNYFPVRYLAEQAGIALRMPFLGKLPLPKVPVGLRLGNIQTLARKAG
jgi:SAM-dependent methyltransferase